ncbi:hypothetical protein Q9L58_006672 [Maublancomyces gigas]|uniref:C2H2-type domain-containing protein n=1 Tax=Discina gigas TaxID=1032678 RepID=A0ABR3GEP7_9PEZI
MSSTFAFHARSVDTRVVRPPDLATQQSWNEDTQRYKCYLCNPVRIGFHTLAAINEHLASPEHKAKSYKCPHMACNLPFNTIGGLVQHIETRSCRCITDSKWWNTYLALPRGGNRPWGMADGTSLAVGHGVEETEEDSATLANLDTEDELALENFWVGRYFAMTGPDGSWVSEGDGYLLQAGFALLLVPNLDPPV